MLEAGLVSSRFLLPLPALYLLWTRRRSACAGDAPAATGSVVSSIRCAAERRFLVRVCCCQYGRHAERRTRLGRALVRVERDQFWESVDRTLPAGDNHPRARCHSSDAPHGIPRPAHDCALRGIGGKFGGRGAYPDPRWDRLDHSSERRWLASARCRRVARRSGVAVLSCRHGAPNILARRRRGCQQRGLTFFQHGLCCGCDDSWFWPAQCLAFGWVFCQLDHNALRPTPYRQGVLVWRYAGPRRVEPLLARAVIDPRQ